MKRIVSLLLAAVIMSTLALPACAAQWITVSSWAYNNVSNFKKAGLLPESFENLDDYTKNITRLQFAELIYSVKKKTGAINENRTRRSYLGPRRYTDTDSEAAGYLGQCEIMEGEIIRTDLTDGMMMDVYAFYPDRILTREEMAAVIYRLMRNNDLIASAEEQNKDLKRPTDYDSISKWAKKETLILYNAGVVSGMEDGSFAPKAHLTIEQAIQILYSYYNLLPTTDEADGANIRSDYEENVQTYSNGLTETKQGDTLYLKEGEKVLMSFETDIYSNIYCRTVNGITYAAAQNVYGKTEVYNARTRELLFKIPQCTSQLTEDFIITKSRNYSEPTYGACSYDGEELLPSEYSMSEIDEIKSNGMKIPKEEYRTPDGWIYYTGESGGIYRIDTNGDNKQKLSDNTTYTLTYADGWLYYLANSQNVTDGVYEPKGYYCTKADGSAEHLISDKYITFIGGGYVEYSVNESGVGIDEKIHYDCTATLKSYMDVFGFDHYAPVLQIDGWLYYLEETGVDDVGLKHRISRMRPSENGIETEILTDDKYNVDSVQQRDGKLYFTDNTKSRARYKERTAASDLYCYDNGTITLLCDKDIQDFGFSGDKLILEIGDNYDETTPYIAELDGSNLRVAEDLKAAQEKEENGETAYTEPEEDEQDKAQKYIPEGGRFERGFTFMGDGWVTYLDNRKNVQRYDIETEETTGVYPSKGLHRCGKMIYAAYKDGCMYKIDEDGNYLFMTDGCAPNFLFVPDGEPEGIKYIYYN